MDFTEAFIRGEVQELLLSDIFNRDHAYVRNYPSDTGLLHLTNVGNFTLVRSVFEDNLLLQNGNVLQYIIDIDNYDHLVIFDCIFRRTMSGLGVYHTLSALFVPDVIISRCLFEENFVIGAFIWISASTSVEITLTECVFENNTASYISFMSVNLFGSSSLQFSHCEFLNNWPYVSSYSWIYNNHLNYFTLKNIVNLTISNCLFRIGNYNIDSNLIAQLVTAHLLNPSRELMEDFLEASLQKYQILLLVMEWGQLRVVNTTIEESTQYEKCLIATDALLESQLFVDRLIARNVTTDYVLAVDRISNLKHSIIIQNSIFQEINGAAIHVRAPISKTTVHISNCLLNNIQSYFGSI